MTLPAFGRLILTTALLLEVLPSRATAAFDVEMLKTKIDIKLDDASMADAAAAVAKLGGIQVAAPAECDKSLSVSLYEQTVQTALDSIALMSGLKWYIEGGVVVFRKPRQADAERESPGEVATPDDAMTALLASLSQNQLLPLSRGVPIAYTDLTPYQQEVLRTMLSPPVVGVAESGDVVKSLPKPEETSLSFYTIPSLTIPKTESNEALTVRLDTTPYIRLQKPATKREQG